MASFLRTVAALLLLLGVTVAGWSGPVVEVPAERVDSYLVLPARLGPEIKLKLLVDTGASHLFLDEQVFRQAERAGKARAIGMRQVQLPTGGTAIRPEVEVLELRLGQFVIPRATGFLLESGWLASVLGVEVGGLAGLGLFAEGRLIWNFQTGRVAVETGALSVPEGATGFALDLESGGGPRIQLQIGSRTVPAVIDSGFSDRFLLPSTGFEFVAPPVVVGVAAIATGLVQDRASRLAINITLAGVTFERPVVAVGPDPLARIGVEVLRHFEARFDIKAKRLWLTPLTRETVTSPPFRSLGLAAAPHPQGLMVVATVPGTEAYAKGIQPGDVITSIQGEPASAWPRERRSRLVETADSVELTFRRSAGLEHLLLKVAILVP